MLIQIMSESLTLCHSSVLCAVNPVAIVKPDNSGIRQTSNFAFEHSLLSLNYIQVVKGFDEVGHCEMLDFILRDFWLLWN